MHRYSLGIDTGGTYTDAAIIDAAGAQVIAVAKALTTKGDLTIGVVEAMERALLLWLGYRDGVAEACALSRP